MLSLESREHLLCLRDADGRRLWGGQLLLAEGEQEHRCDFAAGSGIGHAGPWSVRVSLGASSGLATLQVLVHAAPGHRLSRLAVWIPGERDGVPSLIDGQARALVFGASSGAPDGVLALGSAAPVEGTLAVVLYHPRAGAALLFGLGGPAADFSRFRLDGEGLRAGFAVDRELHRDEVFPLVFGGAPDPLALLDSYGGHLARFARPSVPPQTGWNSWDYYGGAVSMADVRRELRAIKASPLGDLLRWAVVDMGWEQAWGEWAPNRRFPGSLRTMACQIQGTGMEPGLWVAPLQCHIFTPLGRHRQDLLVPGPTGSPATVGQHALLDFSLDEVQHQLVAWFSGMRAAGFRLFKLDYLYASYLELLSRCADATLGKAAVVRRGLAAIRQAVGDESHLLNCGGPVEASLGLADSARVTTDIHTFWGHVRFNARELAARLWQNGRLWRIDPDFAVIRAAGTTRDRFPNYVHQRRPLAPGQGHWMAGPDATRDELNVWLTQVYLSAGNLFLGDSVARLEPQGIADLARLFPPLTHSARPLDLFSSAIPRYWLAADGERSLLGVFNWEDETMPLVSSAGPDLPTAGVDLHCRARIALDSAATMPARSALLLEV